LKRKLFDVGISEMIAVTLIAVMIFTAIGFVITYHVKKFNWYAQQLEAKEGEHTLTLRLTQADFENALVKKHELLIAGEYYDVRSVKKVNDKLEVIAIHDKHEKKLMNILTKSLQDDGSEASQPLHQWLKISFMPALLTKSFQIFYYTLESKIIFGNIFIYEHSYLELVVKPPSPYCG
jgi:hypothetical protein